MDCSKIYILFNYISYPQFNTYLMYDVTIKQNAALRSEKSIGLLRSMQHKGQVGGRIHRRDDDAFLSLRTY
jgi:hypothetical protein